MALADGPNQSSRAPAPSKKQVLDSLFGPADVGGANREQVAPQTKTTTLTAAPAANEYTRDTVARQFAAQATLDQFNSWFGEGSGLDASLAISDPTAFKAQYQESLQSEGRAEAMAARKQRDHQQSVDSYTLTPKQYDALSPQQQSSVDFNTQLVAAREKDLNTDYNASPKQREQYHDEVVRLFGKDGGSYTYAPETLALLDQIKLKPDHSADLDQYLGLENAIDIKELTKERKPGLGTGGLADMLQIWSDRPQDAGAQLTQHERSMEKQGHMVQDLDASLQLERNSYLRNFGGHSEIVKPEAGWGSGALDSAIQKAFETFARADVKPEKAQELFDSAFTKPEWRDAFYKYADTLSARTPEYQSKRRSSDTIEYRSPEEFRKLLGLDPVEK